MSWLTHGELETVRSVADVIVPGQDPMPDLRTADPDGAWVERVLEALPRLVPDLRRVLAGLDGNQLDSRQRDGDELAVAVRALHSDRRPDFDVLGTVVCGAYYLTPQVRALIGYPGQVRNPARFDEAAAELDGELLERLLAQPTIYLPAPERHSAT